MNRRRNLIVVTVALVAVVAVGAFAARPRGSAVSVRMTTVAYGDFETRLPETGYVQRPQTETLAAQVAGNLGGFRVRPGDHVAAGQLVATISNEQVENAARTAEDAYRAAAGRARSARETQVAVPAQNRSAVVQAQATLEQARFNLNQAIQDQKSGAQSGLGYGGTSAEEQRAVADANLAKARTDLGEAKRVYDADVALLAQSAIARNQVDTDRARLDQAQVAFEQASRQRNETYANLARQGPVLRDRVRAARDAVAQAEAALDAARAGAGKSGAGDAQAAQADASARLHDAEYARTQAANLSVRAPFAGVVQSLATQTGDATRPLAPGDPVVVGQALATIAADGAWVVRAKVDEQDIAHVRPGSPAHVGGEDLGGATLDGHVVAINAVAQKSDDPSNTARQIVTTIALDRSLPFLKDGMTVDVDLVTTRIRHAIVVPVDAVRRDEANRPYAFVVRNGVATKTPLVTGAANDVNVVVRSGLAPGDRIVADRSPGVVPGARVTPAPTPTPGAPASAAP